MPDSRLRRVEDVFTRAVALPEAARAAFLDAACAGDAPLRAEVEALLRSDDALGGGDNYLRGPVAAGVVRPPAGDPDDTRPGPSGPSFERAPPACPGYRLLRRIGGGGMGEVFEAEQENPCRRVAIKVIRQSVASADQLRRFELEAQVLGRLRHPGIAQIYQAGVAANGQPFIAMEYVPGQPLLDYVRSAGLGLRDRIALVARVCEAVHHAHAAGVVHRDLKPDNILVDAGGQPRVLDFGVARTTGPDLGPTPTETGVVVGTPAYMSPEQLAGDPRAVDHRCDVYALGVVLYEVAADRPPFDLRNRSLAELARVVAEHEPPRLGAIAAGCRGDVETIAAKALEKDPVQRYRSALDLGDDLRRHLAGEPVRARPTSAARRAAKWCRRNPRVAALLAVTLALVAVVGVGGAVAGYTFSRQASEQAALAARADAERRAAEEERGNAQRAERRAVAEARRAAQVTTFLKGMFEPAERIDLGGLRLGARGAAGGTDLTEMLRQGAEKLGGPHGFRDEPLVRAELLHDLGTAYFGLGRPREAAPLIEEALRLRRGNLSPDDPDLAHTVLAAAQVRSLFEDEANTALFREAIRTRARAGDELGVAEAEASLAVFSWYLDGETDESRRLLERSSATYRRRLGEGDLHSVAVLMALVVLNTESDRDADAARLAGDLLAVLSRDAARTRLAECVRQALAALSARAVLGDRAAVAPARKTVELFAREAGEHHYLTVRARALLAEVVSTPEERSSLLRQCLKSLDEWGVPSTYLRAKWTFDLARLAGDGDSCEHALRASISHFRKLAPKQNQGRVEYPHALQALARYLRQKGGHGTRAEVGALYEEAREYTATHPRVAGYRRAFAHTDAGHWRLLQGDRTVPIEWFQDAAQFWRANPDPETRPHLAEALGLLYYAHKQRGEGTAAAVVRAEALKVIARIPDQKSWNTLRGMQLLNDVLPE